jgi:hypothetical protein
VARESSGPGDRDGTPGARSGRAGKPGKLLRRERASAAIAAVCHNKNDTDLMAAGLMLNRNSANTGRRHIRL